MLKPVNNNALVTLDLTNETENGFSFSEEIKGDGQIVKCKIVSSKQFNANTEAYIPFYSLRQVKGDIYACDEESIIAINE